MCHIQERQLLLAYFLSYFPLIVYAAMLSILNTVSVIIKKLYGFVVKGRDNVLCIKIWPLSCSYLQYPRILCKNSLTRELKIRFVEVVWDFTSYWQMDIIF